MSDNKRMSDSMAGKCLSCGHPHAGTPMNKRGMTLEAENEKLRKRIEELEAALRWLRKALEQER